MRKKLSSSLSHHHSTSNQSFLSYCLSSSSSSSSLSPSFFLLLFFAVGGGLSLLEDHPALLTAFLWSNHNSAAHVLLSVETRHRQSVLQGDDSLLHIIVSKLGFLSLCGSTSFSLQVSLLCSQTQNHRFPLFSSEEEDLQVLVQF